MPFDASPALTTEALDAIALLTRARAFLDERGWTRKRFYRCPDISIHYATIADVKAVCAEGALCIAWDDDRPNFSSERVTAVVTSLAYRAMRHILGIERRIASWNDEVGRGKNDVLAAFDDAANLLRSGWLPS